MSSHVVVESPQHLHDHDSGAFVSHGSNSWPHAVTSHSLTWLEREAMPCYDSVLWGENSGTARLASRRVHCRRRNTKGVQGTRGDARRSEYHDTCWQYSSAQMQYEDDSHRPEPFVFFWQAAPLCWEGAAWVEKRGGASQHFLYQVRYYFAKAIQIVVLVFVFFWFWISLTIWHYHVWGWVWWHQLWQSEYNIMMTHAQMRVTYQSISITA